MSIEFNSNNLCGDKSSWVLTGAVKNIDNTITIQPLGTVDFTILLSSASKYISYSVGILDSGTVEYGKGFSNLEIEYANPKYTKENNLIVINRDKEVNAGVFTNSSLLELKGYEIKSLKGSIYNNSSTPLTIKDIELLTSIDIQPSQIVEITKSETFVADTVHANGVFSYANLTQLVRTNYINTLTTHANPGDTVDTIDMSGAKLSFYTEVLGTEKEQLIIEVDIAGIITQIPLWYASIEGPDAYKYFTTTNPLDVFPNMTQERAELFKVMRYKAISKLEKTRYEFRMTSDGQITPVLVLGAGTGVGTRGQAFINKNNNGLEIIYDKADGTGTIGIIMDDKGVYIQGLVAGHCEYITFKENGFKVKYMGELEHSYEFVMSTDSKIVSIIRDTNYITRVNREVGLV